MRRLILIVLLLLLAPRLHAAEPMSVHQLEAMLAAHDSSKKHSADEATDLLAQINREDELAPKIAQIRLTERLTPGTLQRLVATYKLGPLTRDALELIADRSALLDPPADEIPDLPPPDLATQRTLIHNAGAFVFQTLSHLPDFFAIRTTEHFDDEPLVMNGMVLAQTPGLHHVATYRREITFRDGRELLTALNRERTPLWGWGMETQGEFGPEPAIVFLDIAHGKLAFSHWEKGPSGKLAVFRYDVPSAASHYEIRTACRVSEASDQHPSYHGSLALDEAGTLVRLTLQADEMPDNSISGVASVIEYAPVVLGNRTFVCPWRSLAFSMQQMACPDQKHRKKLEQPIFFLNRTEFTAYHRLGSESTILPGPVVQAGSTPPPATQNPDTPRP
ncbi:MAG: hypothetical protein ACLGSD_08545 [Acidobacteriota bacterium]